MKKLIIVGDGKQAELVHEFMKFSAWPACFAVEREFHRTDELFGLPVVALEDIETLYPAVGHDFHVAVTFAQLNHLRARLVGVMKAMGYTPASIISERAQVWGSARIGEHALICAFNNIDPFVTVGDNCVLWANNHVGHHTTIGDNVMVSSGVTISGNCHIGDNCFFGVNSAVGDGVTIGADCFIGAGALVVRDVPANSLVKAPASPVDSRTAREFFGVADAEVA